MCRVYAKSGLSRVMVNECQHRHEGLVEVLYLSLDLIFPDSY